MLTDFPAIKQRRWPGQEGLYYSHCVRRPPSIGSKLWSSLLRSSLRTAFGSIGGIIATVVFRGQDAPRYQPGFIACLVSQALMIVILIVCSAHFMVKNKAALRNNAATIEGTAGFTYTI